MTMRSMARMGVTRKTVLCEQMENGHATFRRLLWQYSRRTSLLVLLAFSGGCLTPATLEPMRYYTVSPTLTPSATQASDKSLGIRPLIGARPYKLDIAYRSGPNELAYIQQAQWAELPATAAGRAIQDGIVQRQIFADAGDAVVMSRPEFIFTGELRRFEADYTTDPPVFAVLVDGAIRSTPDGIALWQRQIAVNVPLNHAMAERRTESALADIAGAASDAVTQLSNQVCEQVLEALEKWPPPTAQTK